MYVHTLLIYGRQSKRNFGPLQRPRDPLPFLLVGLVPVCVRLQTAAVKKGGREKTQNHFHGIEAGKSVSQCGRSRRSSLEKKVMTLHDKQTNETKMTV